MAKITLTELESLGNEGSFLTALNANFAAITAAIEATLTRAGTSPNAMGANLDMNGYSILNADGDIEATNGIPAGGTTGQVLKKTSDTDYDADWAEDEAGGEGGGGGSGVVYLFGNAGFAGDPASYYSNLDGYVVPVAGVVTKIHINFFGPVDSATNLVINFYNDSNVMLTETYTDASPNGYSTFISGQLSNVTVAAGAAIALSIGTSTTENGTFTYCIEITPS